MKRILITGATGLIGSSLIPLLKDHTVFCLGRHLYTEGKAENIIMDFAEEWDESLLPKQIDAIIHLAQSENFRLFPQKAEDVFDVNVSSTLKLLNYAQKVGAKKFIYASSGGIYGTGNHGFTEENLIHARNDLGFYLSTKLCSEILIENYAPFFDVVMLRFFFAYGAKQKRSMLIPRLVDSVLAQKPIMLQGANGISINPIYVSDAADSIVKSLFLEGNHKINIGGNETLSIREIAEKIGDIVGKKPIYIQNEGIPQNLIGDISKMKQLLHIPSISFEEGIKNLILV
jgi:UDP-glucose 4-epimerase